MEKSYWDQRWMDKQTGWDIGGVSTPLKMYFDQLENKELRILIPGCGNAYEAEYLWEQGFKNTSIVEISALAIRSFVSRYPKFPASNIITGDFFALKGQFDLIIEQTFFCAIEPQKRNDYARHSADLLKPGGKLVGLLFDRHFEGGPPFGGSKAEYEPVFAPFYTLQIFEKASNSIPQRHGNELFIKLLKK